MRNDGMTAELTRSLKTQLSLAQLATAQPAFPDEVSVSVIESILDQAKEMLLMIRSVAHLPSPAQAAPALEGPGVRE